MSARTQPTIDDEFVSSFVPPNLAPALALRLRGLYGQLRNSVIRPLRDARPEPGGAAEEHALRGLSTWAMAHARELESIGVPSIRDLLRHQLDEGTWGDVVAGAEAAIDAAGTVLDLQATALRTCQGAFLALGRMPGAVVAGEVGAILVGVGRMQLALYALVDALSDDDCSAEVRGFWSHRLRTLAVNLRSAIDAGPSWSERLRDAVRTAITRVVASGSTSGTGVSPGESVPGGPSEKAEKDARAEGYRRLAARLDEWAAEDEQSGEEPEVAPVERVRFRGIRT